LPPTVERPSIAELACRGSWFASTCAVSRYRAARNQGTQGDGPHLPENNQDAHDRHRAEYGATKPPQNGAGMISRATAQKRPQCGAGHSTNHGTLHGTHFVAAESTEPKGVEVVSPQCRAHHQAGFATDEATGGATANALQS
jgi:hypothetical protein